MRISDWSSDVCSSDLLAFYFLTLTLRVIPVGVAYSILSGVGIVLVTAAAWVFYGQKPDAPAMAGSGLLVAGVLVINLFPARPEDRRARKECVRPSRYRWSPSHSKQKTVFTSLHTIHK